MNRLLPLGLLAVLLALGAGCAYHPDRDQSQREFERLRERPTRSDDDAILPDFGTDSWTEEALRRLPGSPEAGARA